jgi:hypothetical protein
MLNLTKASTRGRDLVSNIRDHVRGNKDFHDHTFPEPRDKEAKHHSRCISIKRGFANNRSSKNIKRNYEVDRRPRI